MILIIGYGNSLRRDDGAGLILAEKLEDELRRRELDVERIAVHQLTADLALSVAADAVTAVVFVDTRVAAAGDGQIQMDLQVQSLGAEQGSQTLGHHVGPAAILTYARLLYDRSPPAWLLTAPGFEFDHGEGLSEAAERALDTLPAVLERLPPGWPLPTN